MNIKFALRLVFAAGLTTLGGACGDGSGDLDAPVVQSDDAYTNENPHIISGTGTPGAEIQIRGGAEALATGEVDGDGNFSVPVQLKANASNTLLLSQASGSDESTATEYTIIHDDIAPDNPTLDPVSTPTRRTSVTLTGTAEADGEVVVAGGMEEVIATVDAEGRFSVFAGLNNAVSTPTDNNLSVQARDLAGNLSGATDLAIVHNPALPIDAPLLDAVATHTNSTTLTVSGTTEPELEVQIVGSTTVDVVSDEDGIFSASLTLDPNTNTFVSVFGVVSAIGLSSPAAQFSIIHDDVVPASPGLNPLASPTGADVISVSGTTESFATIDIAGAAAAASVVASDTGTFAVDVTLTADADNVLSITATDQAGNVSVAAEVTVTQDSALDAPVVVDATEPFTNQSPISISGSGTPDAAIEILGGAAPATTTADGSGAFSVSVTLTPNATNNLVARHVGGTTATNVSITHDNLPPPQPAINAIASPTNQNPITVSGSAEAFDRINIAGAVNPVAATANGTGQWSVSVTIVEDDTTNLSATATDRAGNVSVTAATASVTHSSAVLAPPNVDDENPPPTNQEIHIVAGSVNNPTPSTVVNIRGGAVDVLGAETNDANGTFSIMVMLDLNQVNTLEVTSQDGAIESAAVNVTITQDNIVPADVDVALVTLGSPELSSCLIRTEQIAVNGADNSAEPGSRVTVTNTSAPGTPSTTTTANANGAFSTNAIVCEGDILGFLSTDAADNASTQTTKSVE